MKVRATAIGFYGGARRREGDVFEVKGNIKSSWFVPLEDQTISPGRASRNKVKKDEPIALSEVQADQPVQDREVI